jgi:hypothetical protein
MDEDQIRSTILAKVTNSKFNDKILGQKYTITVSFPT